MNTIGVILLVAFVIVCVLLVLLVLVQDDGQNGMGGLLGGRGTAAFGSHSASVLTKATIVLVVLFFVLAVFLALTVKSVIQKIACINKRFACFLIAAALHHVIVTRGVFFSEAAELALGPFALIFYIKAVYKDAVTVGLS